MATPMKPFPTSLSDLVPILLGGHTTLQMDLAR